MNHTTADLDAMLRSGSRVSGSAHPADAAAKFTRTVRSHVSDNFPPVPPATVDGPHTADAGTDAARYFGAGALYGVIDHYPGAARPVRTLVVIDVDPTPPVRTPHPLTVWIPPVRR